MQQLAYIKQLHRYDFDNFLVRLLRSTINPVLSLLVIFIACLTGCSSIVSSHDPYASFDPPKIHVKDKDAVKLKEPLKSVEEEISFAERIVFEKYYSALRAASSVEAVASHQSAASSVPVTQTMHVESGGVAASADQWKIYSYLDAGVSLVNTSCLRWFQSLSDLQNKLDLTSAGTNVISELGTTLLGFGKANSIIVGSYGALNSTRLSLEKNYAQIFLLAPNASKIKQRIFQSMKEYETTLLNNSSRLTFLNAYHALEKYADICTHETAKGIIETALANTNAGSDSEGNVTISVNRDTAAAQAAADKAAADKAAADKAAADKAAADKAASEKAKAETEKARAETEKAKTETEKAKTETEKAKTETEKAKAEAEKAKAEAEKARAEAEKARAGARAAGDKARADKPR